MNRDRSLKGLAQAFVADMLDAIRQEPDFGRALTMGEWLGRYLWANFCGIYRLDELELILLDKLDLDVSPSPPSRHGSELHMASSVYRTGGHTQLMKSLMAEASDPPDVLMTRPASVDDVAGILAWDPQHIDVPNGDFDAKAQIIRWMHLIAGYERIVLHVHPDDVGAALAIRLAKRLNPNLFIGFMNHADHAFSVAIGIADRIFEISSYGWALRAQRGAEDRSTFVGIPIAPPKERPANSGQGGFAFSGGTAYKYKPFRHHSLPEVLHKLLRRDPSIRLVIIGPKSKDYWWWTLRWAGGKRVQMMKPIPRDGYLKLLNDCTYYIDSYPWPGGTAFPEALMRGGLVAGLIGGSSGYSYADVLRSESDEAFVDACVKLAAGDPTVVQKQVDVRQRCIAFHAPRRVRQRLEVGFQSSHLTPPPAEMLAHPQVPTTEFDWMDQGRSITPSLKSLRLDDVIRATLLRRHARHFGWLRHASLKLAFDLYLKKVKP